MCTYSDDQWIERVGCLHWQGTLCNDNQWIERVDCLHWQGTLCNDDQWIERVGCLHWQGTLCNDDQWIERVGCLHWQGTLCNDARVMFDTRKDTHIPDSEQARLCFSCTGCIQMDTYNFKTYLNHISNLTLW